MREKGYFGRGNAIKRMRVAFAMTPSELAARMGVDSALLRDIENADRPVTEEWAEAVARALGAPMEALFDEDADFNALADAALKSETRDAPAADASLAAVRVGVRYGFQIMIAALVDPALARDLGHDEVEAATQNVLDYAYNADEGAATLDDACLNRLSQGLQLAVLAALRSREARPPLHLESQLGELSTIVLELIRSLASRPPR